ncbi:MAG: AAA family ATPase, partial [Clostridia bacterium]|nr:AAA family ATPase [Clostridia bacterium]
MLEKLSITNVALIESADINFTSGLNVLSGETGAGKSVILESLNFVLGAKADKSLIRSGQNECKVSAVFNVENNLEIQSLLEEMDFDADDKLIVSRKFTIDGKNSIKLNGNTLNVSMLRKFTGKLVDLHGQSEHYELLNSSNQLNLIDKIGDSDILVIKERIKQKYAEYKELIKELDKLGGSESDRLYRLDILNFQIDEIEKSDVIEGEEEKLLSMKTQFQHYEKIANSLKSVKDGLDSEGCANDILLNVIRCVAPISNLDSKYSDIYNRLSNVVSELDDISSNVNNYLDSLSDFDFDPDEVENRLEL